MTPARLALTAAMAASLVLLSNFFYWLPYAVTGNARRAFVEVGGYIIFYVVNPAVGLVAAAVFAVPVLIARARRPWLWYAGVLGAVAAGYFAFGLLDR